jgi:hypothetical protein
VGSKKEMKKYWSFLIILLLSFWAIRAVLHPGFFPMHDDEQIARLFELHNALVAGQFPPRWVADLGFGFGYPFYNFYPPLVYYLGEVFHLIGFSLIISTKIVIILGFLFSGIFMYLLGKEIFGKVGGLIAVIFYIYAPYHSLDLYVRGALAEFYSFVFLPAVFWSTLKLIKEKNKKWLILNSLFLSFLLLSHNLIVLVFFPFYFAFVVFLLFGEKEKKKIILSFGFSVFLFLGLTAYFWLPALFERKYTLVDQILTRELASYKLHFVYLRQFWDSPWGYGGSIFGLEDGLSFEVGKLHLVLSIFSGILGIYLFLRGKKEGRLFTFYFLLFTFSLFMASFHSQFIWDRLSPLWYVQFPWRFLIFAVLFSSLLSGAVVDYFYKIVKGRFLVKWAVVFIPIFLVILLNKDYFKPARYLEVTDRDYTTEEELRWRVSKMSFEYVPKGITTVLSDIGTTQVDIKKEELPKTSFATVGKVSVREEKNLPHLKRFLVEGEGGVLTINTYYFPGWEVKVDGQKVKVDDNNKLKLITVDVPRGEHRVEAQFTNTPLRNLANILTVASFLSLLVLIFLPKYRGDNA